MDSEVRSEYNRTDRCVRSKRDWIRTGRCSRQLRRWSRATADARWRHPVRCFVPPATYSSDTSGTARRFPLSRSAQSHHITTSYEHRFKTERWPRRPFCFTDVTTTFSTPKFFGVDRPTFSKFCPQICHYLCAQNEIRGNSITFWQCFRTWKFSEEGI